MRKTAIILAGAAIFDLGVVVVSVQAQESSRPSSGAVATAPGTTSNRDHIDQDAQLRGCANGKHLPEAQLSACRDTAPDSSSPADQTRAVDMFLKIDGVNSVQACTARRGEVVRHEGVQQCRIPADGAGSAGAGPGHPPADPAPRGRIMSELSTMEVEIFIKIDAVDTVQACTARRGEVVMREGVQQCRLPASAGSSNLRGAPAAGIGTSPGDADIHKQGLALNFMKIDIHYTARACIAQQGEVVTREGIQQCALPANPGDNRVRPNRR